MGVADWMTDIEEKVLETPYRKVGVERLNAKWPLSNDRAGALLRPCGSSSVRDHVGME